MMTTIVKEVAKNMVYATVAVGLVRITKIDSKLAAAVKAGEAFGDAFVSKFIDELAEKEVEKFDEDDIDVVFDNLTEEEKEMYARFYRS